MWAWEMVESVIYTISGNLFPENRGGFTMAAAGKNSLRK